MLGRHRPEALDRGFVGVVALDAWRVDTLFGAEVSRKNHVLRSHPEQTRRSPELPGGGRASRWPRRLAPATAEEAAIARELKQIVACGCSACS
jgi:hypothetical protein